MRLLLAHSVSGTAYIALAGARLVVGKVFKILMNTWPQVVEHGEEEVVRVEKVNRQANKVRIRFPYFDQVGNVKPSNLIDRGIKFSTQIFSILAQ